MQNALSVVKKSAVASKENNQITATAKTTHSIVVTGTATTGSALR